MVIGILMFNFGFPNDIVREGIQSCYYVQVGGLRLCFKCKKKNILYRPIYMTLETKILDFSKT